MTDPNNEKGPIWLDHARKYLGVSEIKGPSHNALILKWWEAIRIPIIDDETPWCATFVGGVLEECGIPSTRSAAARSYLKRSNKLDRPAVGSIVIFWREKRKGWKGHIGFVVGQDPDGNLMVLGGNQKDQVTIQPFALERVLGYRWPGLYRPYPWRYDLPVYKQTGELSQNET